jgi:hypothetical protein
MLMFAIGLGRSRRFPLIFGNKKLAELIADVVLNKHLFLFCMASVPTSRVGCRPDERTASPCGFCAGTQARIIGVIIVGIIIAPTG